MSKEDCIITLHWDFDVSLSFKALGSRYIDSTIEVRVKTISSDQFYQRTLDVKNRGICRAISIAETKIEVPAYLLYPNVYIRTRVVEYIPSPLKPTKKYSDRDFDTKKYHLDTPYTISKMDTYYEDIKLDVSKYDKIVDFVQSVRYHGRIKVSHLENPCVSEDTIKAYLIDNYKNIPLLLNSLCSNPKLSLEYLAQHSLTLAQREIIYKDNVHINLRDIQNLIIPYILSEQRTVPKYIGESAVMNSNIDASDIIKDYSEGKSPVSKLWNMRKLIYNQTTRPEHVEWLYRSGLIDYDYDVGVYIQLNRYLTYEEILNFLPKIQYDPPPADFIIVKSYKSLFITPEEFISLTKYKNGYTFRKDILLNPNISEDFIQEHYPEEENRVLFELLASNPAFTFEQAMYFQDNVSENELYTAYYTSNPNFPIYDDSAIERLWTYIEEEPHSRNYSMQIINQKLSANRFIYDTSKFYLDTGRTALRFQVNSYLYDQQKFPPDILNIIQGYYSNV